MFGYIVDMKFALGAAAAITGASALIYLLLRPRKRHLDPGKRHQEATSVTEVARNSEDDPSLRSVNGHVGLGLNDPANYVDLSLDHDVNDIKGKVDFTQAVEDLSLDYDINQIKNTKDVNSPSDKKIKVESSKNLDSSCPEVIPDSQTLQKDNSGVSDNLATHDIIPSPVVSENNDIACVAEMQQKLPPSNSVEDVTLNKSSNSGLDPLQKNLGNDDLSRTSSLDDKSEEDVISTTSICDTSENISALPECEQNITDDRNATPVNDRSPLLDSPEQEGTISSSINDYGNVDSCEVSQSLDLECSLPNDMENISFSPLSIKNEGSVKTITDDSGIESLANQIVSNSSNELESSNEEKAPSEIESQITDVVGNATPIPSKETNSEVGQTLDDSISSPVDESEIITKESFESTIAKESKTVANNSFDSTAVCDSETVEKSFVAVKSSKVIEQEPYTPVKNDIESSSVKSDVLNREENSNESCGDLSVLESKVLSPDEAKNSESSKCNGDEKKSIPNCIESSVKSDSDKEKKLSDSADSSEVQKPEIDVKAVYETETSDDVVIEEIVEIEKTDLSQCTEVKCNESNHIEKRSKDNDVEQLTEMKSNTITEQSSDNDQVQLSDETKTEVAIESNQTPDQSDDQVIQTADKTVEEVCDIKDKVECDSKVTQSSEKLSYRERVRNSPGSPSDAEAETAPIKDIETSVCLNLEQTENELASLIEESHDGSVSSFTVKEKSPDSSSVMEDKNASVQSSPALQDATTFDSKIESSFSSQEDSNTNRSSQSSQGTPPLRSTESPKNRSYRDRIRNSRGGSESKQTYEQDQTFDNNNRNLKSTESSQSCEVEPETMFNPSTFPVPSQEQQFIFYEFEVPQNLVGRLIGKKGAFVNKIKASTDASIIIGPHRNRRFKMCSVEGTRHQVDAALTLIRDYFPVDRYPELTLAQVYSRSSAAPPCHPTVNTQAMQIELAAGVVVEVRVSAVVSGNELWVQQPLHPSFSALQRLQSCMDVNYGDGSTTPEIPTPILEQTICVANVNDHWLRAQVIQSTEEYTTVVLLDVGGLVSVAASGLRQIRFDYMSLPFQASQCLLHGIQPVSDQGWSDTSMLVLEELVSNAILSATVVSYTQDGVPLVNLYRRDRDEYVFLNERLVTLGHAVWGSPVASS